MIARINVDGWSIREKMTADPEMYAKFREIFVEAPEDPTLLYSVSVTGDLELILPALAEMGVEPTIKPTKNGMLVGVHEKIRYLETAQKLIRQQIADNGMLVQIHVPNVGLFLVDEVKLLEDACTNGLQHDLDDGWRILCVCPPNGQRRPDYILGRTGTKEKKRW